MKTVMVICMPASHPGVQSTPRLCADCGRQVHLSAASAADAQTDPLVVVEAVCIDCGLAYTQLPVVPIGQLPQTAAAARAATGAGLVDQAWAIERLRKGGCA